jgi:hypothetical protein
LASDANITRTGLAFGHDDKSGFSTSACKCRGIDVPLEIETNAERSSVKDGRVHEVHRDFGVFFSVSDGSGNFCAHLALFAT